MPDITLCSTVPCALRESCHRATAFPSTMQSYASFSPGVDKHGDTHCKAFLRNSAYRGEQPKKVDSRKWQGRHAL